MQWKVMTVAIALLACATGLAAQDAGDRGAGSSTSGRLNRQWQGDIENAREALAILEADLSRLPEAEWKESSVAWLRLDVDEEGEVIHAPESWRVGEIEADRKSEVIADEYAEEPAWQIRFSKKPPRKLEMVLTDVDATRVDCALRPALSEGRGFLGVFVHDGALFCFFRAGVEAEGDDASG